MCISVYVFENTYKSYMYESLYLEHLNVKYITILLWTVSF